MNLETRIEQKQTQQLILTPQMKLAIHLLQLPLIELNTFLEEQIVENPVLEKGDESFNKKESDKNEELPSEAGSKKDEIDRLIDLEEQKIETFGRAQDDQDGEERRRYPEDITTRVPTLHEHLMMQLDIFPRSDLQKTIAETIIYSIDKNGYLRVSPDEIAVDLNASVEEVEKTLFLIQGLSPAGVGARSLSECLMLQLKRKGKEFSLAGKIVKMYLTDLEKKRFKEIAKGLGVSINEVKNAFLEISRLEPKPGGSFGKEWSRYIIPDILLYSSKDGCQIEINNESIPEFRISPFYRKLLRSKNTSEETRQYLKKKLEQALWLVKAVEQRNATIKKVAGCIIKVQKEFLDNGPEFLKPLTLKEVAQSVGVSESTVSRVVAKKYIHTPHGIFELKRFFNGEIKQNNGESLSSENVRARIKELVHNEEPSKPLNDDSIVKILRSEGIIIARRTVTKYRKLLKITTSNQRRSLCLE